MVSHKTKKPEKPSEFDVVVKRMLATPPEPHKPKATKPKAKAKKKPAK